MFTSHEMLWCFPLWMSVKRSQSRFQRMKRLGSGQECLDVKRLARTMLLLFFFGAWGLPPGEHNTKAA